MRLTGSNETRYDREPIHSRVHSGGDTPNFLVVETWETREKYEKYFAWRTERGDIENMQPLLEGDLSLRFFDRIGA